MPLKCLPILFLLLSLPALAQDSHQYRACAEKAKTQREMTICAGDELKRTDAELDEVYRKLLLSAASDKGSAAKIRTTERAWIAYRDAYMEAMFPGKDKQREYGSSYMIKFDLACAGLTRRQIAALEDLLEEYRPK